MIALEQSSDRAEIYAAASTNQVEESMQALSRVSSCHAHAQCALYMHLYMLCCFSLAVSIDAARRGCKVGSPLGAKCV